jgi:hypothetical protein
LISEITCKQKSINRSKRHRPNGPHSLNEPTKKNISLSLTVSLSLSLLAQSVQVMLPTPIYKSTTDTYEPAEDTFLLIDAIELETKNLKSLRPTISLEMGSGSGLVTAFLAQLLENTCCN